MLAKIQVEMSWAPWRSLNVAGTLEVAPPSKERYGRKRRHANQVQKEDRKMAYIRYKEGCMEASTGARTVVSQACVADGPLHPQVYFPGGGRGRRGQGRCTLRARTDARPVQELPMETLLKEHGPGSPAE
jgi:hypothetical protein